jgi:putative Holliday junction resolvase
MKILGVDYGKKRVGLATSVPGISFAVGYKLLEINESGILGLIENIKEIVAKEQITSIVLGLPRQLDNDIGIAGREVIQFAESLKKDLSIPVILWDERLTSKQAEVLLRDARMSHKDKRAQLNITAAQVMLQSYLDAQATKTVQTKNPGNNPDEN